MPRPDNSLPQRALDRLPERALDHLPDVIAPPAAATVTDVTLGGTYSGTAGVDYFLLDFSLLGGNATQELYESTIENFDFSQDKIVIENAPELFSFANYQEADWSEYSERDASQLNLLDVATWYEPSGPVLEVFIFGFLDYSNIHIDLDSYVTAQSVYENNVIVTSGDFILA